MSKFKVTQNTDTVDIRAKSIGLSVTVTDAPRDSQVYDDRGLHVQIRHNGNALTFDLAIELARLIQKKFNEES